MQVFPYIQKLPFQSVPFLAVLVSHRSAQPFVCISFCSSGSLPKSLYSYSESNEDFDSKYETRFGAVTGILSGFGYDSYNVMIENYNENIDKWNSNMINHKKEGVTGKISFNKEGLRTPQFKIAEVINGELVSQ